VMNERYNTCTCAELGDRADSRARSNRVVIIDRMMPEAIELFDAHRIFPHFIRPLFFTCILSTV